MAMPRRFLVLALAFLGAACASAPTPLTQAAPPGATVVAFVHADVIPMDRERVLRDHTVVIAGGRIAEVGPASTVKVPARAVRIDATGRYPLPVFADMHVHLLGEAWNIMLPPDAQKAGKDIPFDEFLFPFIASFRSSSTSV